VYTSTSGRELKAAEAEANVHFLGKVGMDYVFPKSICSMAMREGRVRRFWHAVYVGWNKTHKHHVFQVTRASGESSLVPVVFKSADEYPS